MKSSVSTVSAGYTKDMTGCLSDNVQVRKESWGLLFYSQPRHKVCFVRSGDWLYPEHLVGTWTFDGLVDDIVRCTGTARESIKRSVEKIIKHLLDGGMIDFTSP